MDLHFQFKDVYAYICARVCVVIVCKEGHVVEIDVRGRIYAAKRISVCAWKAACFFYSLYKSNRLNVCQAFSRIHQESPPPPSQGMLAFSHLKMKKKKEL